MLILANHANLLYRSNFSIIITAEASTNTCALQFIFMLWDTYKSINWKNTMLS